MNKQYGNSVLPVTNKQVVRAFVDAVNAQDWSSLQRLLDPAFERHSVAAGEPRVRRSDDLIRFLQAEYETFPDAIEDIEDMIAENDKVAVRHRFRGTQAGALGQYPASNIVLEATYLAIYRIRDGRIIEAWAEWDNLYSLRQLGHIAA